MYASTADFYRRFRSRVPAKVAEYLTLAAPKSSPRRLLDVGTGPGFVVDALLPHFDEAVGIDVDADLLQVAREDVADLGEPVRFIQAPAESFTLDPGWRAQLVTVCRAFHWFDRPRFLRHITDYMTDDGVLAVFGDLSIWAGGDEWKDRAREVVQDMLGQKRRAGNALYQAPQRDYEDDLVEAGFTHTRRVRIPVARQRSVESVIGLLHSMSFASPALLGARINDFDNRVREALEPLTDNGLLLDHNEFYILTSRRP